jgi:hypothetical protein
MEATANQYLVPYIQTAPLPGQADSLHKIWLFLERNCTHMMEIAAGQEPLAAARDFLVTNDLVAARDPFQVGPITFVEIDEEKTDLSQFYSWREAPPGTVPPKEAWRHFLWVRTADSADPWGVNRLLNTIPLGPAPHTAFTVLDALFTVTPNLKT